MSGPSATVKLCVVFTATLSLFDGSMAQPNRGSYYNSPGGTSSSGCEVVACSCPAGQYSSGCGIDGLTPYASPGTCISCSNLPSNAVYAATPLAYSASTCSFSCNSGYNKDIAGTSCVATGCTTPTDIHAVVSGSGLSCTYTCNGGYISSPTQTAAYACPACSAGKFSSAGQQVCTDCATNSYNTLPGQASCTLCSTIYTALSKGYYLNGCGGASAGSTATCSGPP